MTEAKAKPKKPKDTLERLIKQGHVQPEYRELGEHILKLAEMKHRETMPHMHFDGGTGGGGMSGPDARLTAGRKWDRLMAVVGAEGEALIACVLLEGKSLGDTATALNLNPKAVLPLLKFTLGVLERS